MIGLSALRLGIIGFGTIGSYLTRSLADDPHVQVVGVYTPSAERLAKVPEPLRAAGIKELLATGPDLVVEAAHAQVVQEWGPALVEAAHFMPLSLTALADDGLREALAAAAQRAGRGLFIPHGGIIALDGLRAARRILTEVTITTTKPPRSMGRSDTERTVVFEGTTREACRLLPRNVNVHAALALAGVGFDRQRSVIIVDPIYGVNRQEVRAVGQGLEWTIRADATAGSGVTGAFTPESTVMSVRRVAGGDALRFV